MSCRIGKCISKSREHTLGAGFDLPFAKFGGLFLSRAVSTYGFRNGTIFMQQQAQMTALFGMEILLQRTSALHPTTPSPQQRQR
jgi:hypothetical protein